MSGYATMVAGSELPAMSDWLDQHRERLEPATSDLRGRPVRQTGYCGRCWSPFFELRCSNSAASRSTRNWRSIVRTRQAFRDLHVCRCIGVRRHPRGPSRTSRPGEWSSMVELQLPKLIRCHRSGPGQRLLGTRTSVPVVAMRAPGRAQTSSRVNAATIRSCAVPQVASSGHVSQRPALAALVPRPRSHLVRFHGLFAANARHRRLVVPALSAPVGDSVEPDPVRTRAQMSLERSACAAFSTSTSAAAHVAGQHCACWR